MQIGRIPRRGLTLLETAVAVSLLAVLSAVFLSLSVRLAYSQNQQETRLYALNLLEKTFARLREMSPVEWVGPWEESYSEAGTEFHVRVALEQDRSDPDQGFAVFSGSVTWASSTGSRTLKREVWVHEKLK